MIQITAGNYVARAHRNGGSLFRSSFVMTPEEMAMLSFQSKNSYSEFSEVFRDFIYSCSPKGIESLYVGYSNITDDFYNLYTECIARHQNAHAYYQKGKIFFDRGLYGECLGDIQAIINSAEWDKTMEIKEQKNTYLLTQGQAQIENGAYEDAINTLSDLIKRDPKNKSAYFNRALAHFETGDFDKAISDYLISEKAKVFKNVKSKSSNEFNKSLLEGLTKGSVESAKEFFPSLWHSMYGLGEALWSFTQHPIDTTTNFCNACYEIGGTSAEYFRNFDWDQIEGYASEFKQLYEKFDHLTDAEKGHLIGFSIGKYGVDIFAGGATLKGAMALKKLKNANRVCNIEVMAAAHTNNDVIIASAIEHSTQRKNYFNNVKIHWDSQNKHVIGKHNYEKGRSIFIHEDAQGLLTKFAGKGKPANNKISGMPDYRERVDFGEFIGYYVPENNPNIKMPTNKGIIFYRKTGAHIIPANPEGH